MQPYPRADLRLGVVGRLGVLFLLTGGVAQLAQRAHAAAIQRRKFDAEFAAPATLTPPSDAAFHDDLAAAIFEAADQRRAVVRQVGGAQMHAARAHVDRFGLERRNPRLVPANFDQSLDPYATSALGASFLIFWSWKPLSSGGISSTRQWRGSRVPSRVEDARTKGQISSCEVRCRSSGRPQNSREFRAAIWTRAPALSIMRRSWP